MLVRELLLFEPWKYHGSVERGHTWKRISESLNALEHPIFKVDDRAVRDRYKLLEKKFKKKESDEYKASGISPDVETEVELGIRDIIEQFNDSNIRTKAELDEKKRNIDNDTHEAEELRKESLEKFGETHKHNSSDSEFETPAKKRTRASGSETIAYLREKSFK